MLNPFEKTRRSIVRSADEKSPSPESIDEKRLTDFKRFFKPPMMARYGGHPLDQQFTLLRYVEEQFQQDWDAQEQSARKARGGDRRAVAEEYAMHYARDLLWLSGKGLIQQIGDQTYKLTETGEAYFKRKH